MKPVAWQWLDTANFRKKLPKHANKCEWKPLYTAPRELSDEEIKDIWNKSLLWALNGESLENDMPMSVYFYKEILKKASE